MTTSATSIRMDDDLKKAVNTKLDALGMNFNTFVVMASKQLVAQNRLPFDTTVPQAFDREAAIDELNQINQAKPVQQVAEELADYHFD